MGLSVLNMGKNTNFKLCSLALSGIIVFTSLCGCSDDADCDINQYHAHNYVSENGFDRYIVSEKEKIGGLFRTDEYIAISEDIEDLIKFENKEGLFRISQNSDKINEITSSQSDYLEYRYKYRWLQLIPTKVGDITIMNQIWHTAHSWTDNSSHKDLTGEQRMVHYVYYGYKIIKDDNGDFKAIQSEMVDDLCLLSDEYIYIKTEFCKKVYLENKNIVIDYEDGPEEEKPNYNKEHTEEYEKQLEQSSNLGTPDIVKKILV